MNPEHYLEKELYQHIREDKSIFEFLQSGLLDGIWYWDLEHPENEWMSPRFWAILGYDPEEKRHLSSEWQDLIFPQDLPVAMDNFHKHCADPDHPYDQIVRYRHKNGSTVWVRCRGIAIRDKAGKPIRMLGAQNDLTPQKQAEEALLEQEEKYKSLFNNAEVGMYRSKFDGSEILEANRKFLEIVGMTREEVIGKPAVNLWAEPEKREKILKRLNTDGNVSGFEFKLLNRRQGNVRNCLTSLRLYREQGVLEGSVLDITERVKVEEALRNSEFTLNSLLETVPLPVFYQDKEGRYLKVNTEFERFFGKSRQQVIGKTAFDINPIELAKTYHAGDDELLENREILIYDTQVQGSNSALYDVIAYKAPVFDVQGSINGLVGVFLDITDRKRAEENLCQYERIVSSTEDMLVLLDRNFVFLAVNRAYLKAFDKSSDQVIGRTAGDVFGQELFQTFIRPRAERCLAGETTRYRNWFDYPTLGRRYIDVVYSPYLGPDGGVHGIVLTVRDITEYQNLQAQLSQAQKMESVGRLAGGVAHDYNNMLSIIMGYGELAKEKVAPGDPLYADLTEILSAAKRSVDITRQLLVFSRQQTIAPKVLDINDTVESMLKMLRRLIGENIDLIWMPERNVWQVKMDPSQVDQILANLCVNARDAIADVGKVTIETQNMHLDEEYCANNAGTVPGDYVVLAVSDNGCGISTEAMDKIFEPFFTTKSVGQGTGLGLAIVYGIAKQNGGFIKAYSKPGKGTTIKVHLPRHMGSSVEQHPEDTLDTPLSAGETILLVEDDISILKLSKKMLKHLGYQVLSTDSPTEAFRLAAENPGKIDLLMTDVVMPIMNGRELSDQMQSIYPDLKVLFTSGYTANAIAHKGVLEEGLFFIPKPFSKSDLAVKIREVLDHTES